MKYDQKTLPLGSRDRVIAQLEKGDLIKALKTCREGNIPLENVKTELESGIESLYKAGSIGPILSGYYFAGRIGKYSVEDLLSSIFGKNDFPAFLKQVYRFGIIKGFEDKIEKSISWHEGRNLPDARAWRIKFGKLLEQEKLQDNPLAVPVKILSEEESLSSKTHVYLELRPIERRAIAKDAESLPDVSEEQPYIFSQIQKNKLDRANKWHSETLTILKNYLFGKGSKAIETKLIDAFAVVNNHRMIFEVKSITPENEREQIRSAVSQLYEYRFLYSIQDAILFAVFSEQPFSKWQIDYLTNDRGIHVLWVENGTLTGSSIQQISKTNTAP